MEAMHIFDITTFHRSCPEEAADVTCEKKIFFCTLILIIMDDGCDEMKYLV